MKNYIYIFFLLSPYFSLGQDPFNLHFSEKQMVETKNGAMSPSGATFKTNTNVIFYEKNGEMVFHIFEKLDNGDIVQSEWKVVETLSKGIDGFYYFTVTNPIVPNGMIAYATYHSPSNGFGLFPYSGTGFMLILGMNYEDGKKLNESFDVISSDGTFYYHFNNGHNVKSWVGNTNEQLIYITPFDISYTTEDSLKDRKYILPSSEPFTSFFSKRFPEKEDNIYTIVGNGIETAEYKSLRKKYFFPKNIEIVSYKAECPTCKNENWEIWETLNGLLMFTCNETSRVKLTVKYKVKSEAKDTVYIEKVVQQEKIVEKKETVINKEIFETSDKKVKITIYDNATVDGDIITLKHNERDLIKNFILDKCKASFEVNLVPGFNIFTLKAENLGSIPPNTAVIEIIGNGIKKQIILKADIGYSESFTIISK